MGLLFQLTQKKRTIWPKIKFEICSANQRKGRATGSDLLAEFEKKMYSVFPNVGHLFLRKKWPKFGNRLYIFFETLLARVNGAFEWDDGTALDYQNWAEGELQQNKVFFQNISHIFIKKNFQKNFFSQ